MGSWPTDLASRTAPENGWGGGRAEEGLEMLGSLGATASRPVRQLASRTLLSGLDGALLGLDAALRTDLAKEAADRILSSALVEEILDRLVGRAVDSPEAERLVGR